MHSKKLLTALAFVALAAAVPASARDIGVSAMVGTTGLGIHGSTPITSNLNARVGANFFGFGHNVSTEDVDYDAKLKLRTVDALIDYFPTAGSFRVSTGVMWNGNRFDVTGKPNAGGTFTVNGNTYTATEVGSLHGKVDFRSLAPYLGIGWGKGAGAEKGWSITSDLGVMFQGRPRSHLTNDGCTAPAATCTQLASDIAAENQKVEDKLKNFRFYPVARVGVQYRY